jgi:alpha-amylase/alpha-mannosidase (GH57 family)
MINHKYICIHGHFYQPPRENAWLEEIEIQDSAYPYHDWNERITAECYGPNAVSRILESDNRISNIVNNYSGISFNFGPTLLSWLEDHSPDVYKAILQADKDSIARFGQGSAIAQVYNHLIMPLANRLDKTTQVVWGIRDFEQRFGRKPEGMWLAETAADTETLEVLAENGISFTIMAPRQLKAVRKIGEEHWNDVPEAHVDTLQHYRCQLPSGKSIIIFFYNGPLAQKVAFEGLLKDGKAFADAILGAFDTQREKNQLVHIDTDCESYGHHHRYGEMALSYCLKYIEDNQLATITNYASYAKLVAPEFEVQIHENSSWSCVHGVERWRSDVAVIQVAIPITSKLGE